MKNRGIKPVRITRNKTYDQGYDTDIQSSWNIASKRKTKEKLKPKKRTPRRKQSQLKKLNRVSHHLKILRFRMGKTQKIVRVYCYNQQDLGWPVRLTKKIINMTEDNDRQSDSELVQQQVERNLSRLWQAIKERKQKK